MVRFLLLPAICFGIFGQAPSTDPLAFEVASIKPADMNTNGSPWRVGPDSFTGRTSLKDLIQFAYDIEDYQIEGGPAWLRLDMYDLQAKAASVSTSPQIKSMLRTLLADRFHLRMKRETKAMTGYALVIDKGGPKLPAPRTGVPPDSKGVIQMGGGEIWSRASRSAIWRTRFGLNFRHR